MHLVLPHFSDSGSVFNRSAHSARSAVFNRSAHSARPGRVIIITVTITIVSTTTTIIIIHQKKDKNKFPFYWKLFPSVFKSLLSIVSIVDDVDGNEIVCFESGGSRAVAPALSSSLATTMAHGLYGSGCLHGSQRPWPMACTTGSRAGLRAEKEEDDDEDWGPWKARDDDSRMVSAYEARLKAPCRRCFWQPPCCVDLPKWYLHVWQWPDHTAARCDRYFEELRQQREELQMWREDENVRSPRYWLAEARKRSVRDRKKRQAEQLEAAETRKMRFNDRDWIAEREYRERCDMSYEDRDTFAATLTEAELEALIE